MNSQMTMGVVGTSFKENELRVPIHPDHFDKIDPELKSRIYLEKGYGAWFTGGREIEGFAGYLDREELFGTCDIMLLPKPCADDFPWFREGQVIWGWPHCIQGPEITQVGIDKKLTFIAWEEMHQWREREGEAPTWVVHTFHKNNEMAGYCSVLHALQLVGYSGHYGPAKKAAVISFGATAQGASYALQAMGIQQVTVYKQRSYHDLVYQIPTLEYRQFKPREPGSQEVVAEDAEGNAIPMAEELAQYDIIVNCILQDTNNPIEFVSEDQVPLLKQGALIIDVSCDKGLGFPFARPTSFQEPTFKVGQDMTYYAVDHSPSYLWNSASYEISTALLPYLPTVLGGPLAWSENTTINRAIDIKEGIIQNRKILDYQGRAEAWPHPIIT